MRLNCPRCGFTISPRSAWLTVEYCPRCLARDRRAVQLREPDRATGEQEYGDTSTAMPEESDTPSARWISSFNARDLAGMLACLDRDVRFHPLKLNGVASSGYRGHAGVERWFAEITGRGHEHRIMVSEFRTLPAGVTLTIGRLSFADVSAATPVCGVHEVADELIVTAHHYMSDPDTLERLGLLKRRQKPGNSGNLRISETSQMIGP
jgi:SnoaL-like protein